MLAAAGAMAAVHYPCRSRRWWREEAENFRPRILDVVFCLLHFVEGNIKTLFADVVLVPSPVGIAKIIYSVVGMMSVKPVVLKCSLFHSHSHSHSLSLSPSLRSIAIELDRKEVSPLLQLQAWWFDLSIRTSTPTGYIHAF